MYTIIIVLKPTTTLFIYFLFVKWALKKYLKAASEVTPWWETFNVENAFTLQ